MRLRVAGGRVRPQFVPEPQPGDETIEVEGIRVFIDRRIVDELGEVEVTTSAEHDTLEVRAK